MQIKIIPSILMSLCCAFMAAQEATEIYLFDLSEQDSQITISNPVNISKNEGYDNQPSFTEDGTGILFSSFREGQADISKYFIAENYRVWITDTKESEFSPIQVPGKKKYFTCVRLNEDDTQYIYKYAFKKKLPELFIPDLKVGYYIWFDPKTLISFVIGDTETLQVSSFKHKIRYPIRSNIGRSMHKIPESAGLGSNLMSFISLSHESPEIYSIDPFKSTSVYIADALAGSRDLTWTARGTMLMGKNNMIYKYHPSKDKEWIPINIEAEFDIQGISRIIISPDGSKLVLVANEPAL
ncbi:TolB family protein [Lutimonas sp.]|uniref:TolB family protein n=1 Tax=Lutimonas sp. TaxID=1872403 RepID=UPI003D9AC2A9